MTGRNPVGFCVKLFTLICGNCKDGFNGLEMRELKSLLGRFFVDESVTIRHCSSLHYIQTVFKCPASKTFLFTLSYPLFL